MMGPGAGPHTGFFTKDLDLDDAQQKKVQAILDKAKDDKATPPDPEATKKKWDSLLSEFEKDTFDAKKLEAFTDKAEGRMMGPMNPKVLAEILPILKPEQREKLAARMEKGPMHKGPPGMAPMPPGAKAPDDDDDSSDQ
jgi:Spy/CpxP family protein refolding chaperone